MRVALLTASAPARNAIGNQVAEKLAYFLERGADARVVTESVEGLHPDARAHCLVLDEARTSGRAWDFLAGADLLIVDYAHFYGLLELLPMLADGRARIVLDYHGVSPPDSWPAQHRAVLDKGARQRGLAWCADAVLVHSRFTGAELIHTTGFPRERVDRLGYPIDLAVFSPGRALRSLRERLGLDHASLLFFVGRLAPNKEVPVLVEAVAHLRERQPSVHAVIVGDTSDIYAGEAERCRELAQRLGVPERVHFLGQLSQEDLVSAYGSADLFVMPSSHEGFCVPVIEAMACGLPVIAARSTALPETVATGGLTFAVNDAGDLARQIARVLDPQAASPRSGHLRVAVVSVRYGTDFPGGAETSLRTMAEALHRAGHAVEVFTTCTRSESDWSNELPASITTVNGLTVHRFPVDPCDRESHLATVQAIVRTEGRVSAAEENDYVRHSVHSTRLLEALRERADSLDAIIVGPYLFGLTCDVAREFAEKTLVMPCFHDEPFARLRTWVEVYERAGGILYHTHEEQEFAQSELGINHPRGVTIGTLMPCAPGHPAVQFEDQASRYLVYCGRYSKQKGLGELLDLARRYQQERPGRFRFVFLGQGEVPIPREPWAYDAGFADDARKRDLLAGADALVQLSRQESLSLVALEAWAQGTPVIAHARCTVLAGQLQRSGGGRAIDGYAEFAAALDDLWEHPPTWRALGQKGREYVRREYADAGDFTRRLVEAIEGLARPIGEQMRRRGLQRARAFGRDAWREQFGELVDRLLHAEPRARHSAIEVRPRQSALRVTANTRTALLPLQLIQCGTTAALAEGPGRTVIRSQVLDAETGRPVQPAEEGVLPGLLIPGKAQAAAISLRLPVAAGRYRIVLWTERVDQREPGAAASPPSGSTSLDLVVEAGAGADRTCCAPLLDVVQDALVEAHGKQKLPDDYVDVSAGALAGLKRRLKRKVLGNFKHAYVDVLSRQQSQVNEQLVTAVQHLAECCATLDHALRMLQQRVERLEGRVSHANAQVVEQEESSDAGL